MKKFAPSALVAGRSKSPSKKQPPEWMMQMRNTASFGVNVAV